MFGLTPVGAALCDGPMRWMALWIAGEFNFHVYANAMHSVMTGESAVPKTTGSEVFEHFARNPELSKVFNDAMTGFSTVVIPAIVESYDFSGIRTLVDVAGGHGAVLTAILEKHPGMKGILFDVDHVIAGATPRIEVQGLAGRVSTASGDFFKAVPSGGDAYIMKHIIHDWDDEKAALILSNIRAVLPKDGRVILLEAVIPAGNEPGLGKIIDLEMLVMPGGRERTEEEFRALFDRAGFTLTRIVPTASPLSVVEAKAEGLGCSVASPRRAPRSTTRSTSRSGRPSIRTREFDCTTGALTNPTVFGSLTDATTSAPRIQLAARFTF
jgi:hypothetical protein